MAASIHTFVYWISKSFFFTSHIATPFGLMVSKEKEGGHGKYMGSLLCLSNQGFIRRRGIWDSPPFFQGFEGKKCFIKKLICLVIKYNKNLVQVNKFHFRTAFSDFFNKFLVKLKT